jgi:hypothetical protein
MCGSQGLYARFGERKIYYVSTVEPRIIQLLSVTISFSGYLNAALAEVFGENSYCSRAVLVCVVCTAVPLVVVLVGLLLVCVYCRTVGCGVGWFVY